MDPNRFRKLLINQLEILASYDLINMEAAKPVELDQTRVGRLSRMDALQSQAMSLQTKQRREEQIKMIHAANHRLDEGTYGTCLRCDADIPEKRLEIDPCTTLCISCAAHLENSR
ncbi:MAG: TraR/DksA family transcriptional regulator [Thiohalomonadales bacterium]